MNDKSLYIENPKIDCTVWETNTYRLMYYSGFGYNLQQFSSDKQAWYSVAWSQWRNTYTKEAYAQF